MTRILKRLLGIAVVSACMIQHAQPQSLAEHPKELNQSQIDFFGFLLKQIADPTLSPESRVQSENRIVKKFGLDPSEASGLHAVAQECLSISTDALAAARRILGTRAVSTPSDQIALAQLDSLQRSRLAQWSMTITGYMRPETLKRFDMVIIYPTNLTKR